MVWRSRGNQTRARLRTRQTTALQTTNTKHATYGPRDLNHQMDLYRSGLLRSVHRNPGERVLNGKVRSAPELHVRARSVPCGQKSAIADSIAPHLAVLHVRRIHRREHAM